MTRAEIKRHAAAILALRERKDGRGSSQKATFERGYHTGNDHREARRRTFGATRRNAGEGGCAPVDQMFDARERAGWLPRNRDV